MANEDIMLYRHWLNCGLEAGRCYDKNYVKESFQSTIQQSPAFQSGSLVNGVPQPLVATRKETKKCAVTVLPNDTLYIGDLVEVFNEHWLCVDLYIDEYDMRYGELWMCNQIFNYQDHNGNIIQKYAVLDDGSYSNGADKPLMVTDNSFNCYISLDDESKSLFIDKRLAISVIQDSKGNDILEVGKIKWIDVKSKNFGKGSHLMVFGINDDAFAPENDSIDKMICDYVDNSKHINEDDEVIEDEILDQLVIEGRTSLKHGIGRSYNVIAISNITGETLTIEDEVLWSLSTDVSGIALTPNGTSCKVTVAENDNLIGTTFTLKCESVSNKYNAAEFIVEVI